MTRFVALLRAVNVAGHGKLAMSDLVRLCEGIGFEDVRTYIASGNVVFQSDMNATAVKANLEAALLQFCGRSVPVMVRDADEIAAAFEACPFQSAPGNQVAVVFLDDAPLADALSDMPGATDEVAALGIREIYIHYPSGMGRSKLRLKALEPGTARNMNTVKRLVEMARGT